MNEPRRNFLVGLFMIGGLVALGTLMVFYGENPAWLGGAEYGLKMRFRSVEGVAEGTPINLNGVQIGRVGELVFDNPQRPGKGVSVVGLIKQEYSIPTGATAHIVPGVMGIGRGHIEIRPPEVLATEPLDHETAGSSGIAGVVESPFEGLLPATLMASVETTVERIGTFAEAATPLADDLHLLFQQRTVEQVDRPTSDSEQLSANLSTAVQRLDDFLRNLNDVVGDPKFKESVLKAVENFYQMTEDGKATFAMLRETAGKVDQQLVDIGKKLDDTAGEANAGIREMRERLVPAAESLAAFMVHLNHAGRDLAEGNGTAGLLLRDPRLYEAAALTFERLTDAIDVIRSILNRWMRQGYIEFKAHTAVGPVKVQQSIKE